MPLHYACPIRLLETARRLPPMPTAVAAAASPYALAGARQAREQGVLEPVLVGDAMDIRRMAKEMGWPLDGVRIERAGDDADAARRAVALAHDGECMAVMKGHLHTDTLMLAALQKQGGLRAGRRFTHAFFMAVPGWTRGLIVSDAAVNIRPSVEAKVDIVRNVVDLAHALSIPEPRVALLSSTEEVTDRIQSSLEAAEVAARCRDGAVKNALVHGPLPFDVAMSPDAARVKGIDHPVAGHADALVVADIDAGNALFKMMVHFMGASAAGVVLGASVPIMLTSRADSPEARLNSATVARLLAEEHASALRH
ncbi:bifunctional enoyl-CoA hydratase/phosphate acetyltransferase [Magnetospirillum sp. UT-4]|uniref:bifunctional enoyl-CoA hydratase/phosphate acetyltransferase n=1 Tax=Magnetospirillum sp. UT-4 TaxID=2681467 RepID=UPI00137DE8B0|nr:bifunctional enoyl-CoA hydratase/phosphate acetyltransferase [Magnetospirillum sp. UT-4]CAA7614333.1 Phosphate acetyltransferase [Magnetospirillum sp. UT-4]